MHFPVHLLLLLLLLPFSQGHCSPRLLLSVGTSTPPSPGIHLLTLRSSTFLPRLLIPVSLSGPNPTFLAPSSLSPSHIFSINTINETSSLRRLTFLSTPPFLSSVSAVTPGFGLAHLLLLPSSSPSVRHVIVTSDFLSGSVSVFLDHVNNRLTFSSRFVVPPSLSAGTLGVGRRQLSPHPHMTVAYKRGVLMTDLGVSGLFYLGVDRETGRIWEIERTMLQKADGCRHMVVGEENVVYVVNELSNTLVALREGNKEGVFEEESRWDLVDEEEKEISKAAAVRKSENGEWVYVSVRRRDMEGLIVGCRIGERGTVKGCEKRWGSGGRTPRDFWLGQVKVGEKCEKVMVVANRDENEVVALRRYDNGNIGQVIQKVKVESPTSVVEY